MAWPIPFLNIKKHTNQLSMYCTASELRARIEFMRPTFSPKAEGRQKKRQRLVEEIYMVRGPMGPDWNKQLWRIAGGPSLPEAIIYSAGSSAMPYGSKHFRSPRNGSRSKGGKKSLEKRIGGEIT
ncbi:uncharacterized protein LOC122037104 [Zingiber officinale]|uniref:uncharacterized protein LOC122037104 n=1 Tax=Zingiber officinale TaxID=94328 RepID=UPI001C4C4CA0|nr:uncharacterized protein LOC122037104 [Zingiber officinale]